MEDKLGKILYWMEDPELHENRFHIKCTYKNKMMYKLPNVLYDISCLVLIFL